ncbi:GGDEF domain-containing protein [Qipengyuania sp. RANM35]|uniref:GGDEF domain-containing protein n=1 Tax=Qipengyuania sp. RANM35 TaxID=3068635 RepID=UPI0034DAFB83
MSRWTDRLLERAIPDLPEAIRDDYFVHAANELQRKAPWLFKAMFVNSLIAMFAGAPEAHWVVRYVLPGIMAAYCAMSIVVLRNDWQFAEKPWRARKFMFESSVSSVFGAVLCTTWCILSWWVAPVEARLHFPIILAMGGLATAFCLSGVKLGSVANLFIDLVPIALLMIFMGTHAEAAAALSLLMAGVFQMVMIDSQQARVIQLLTLQDKARHQAQTDALTGLANRRAVLELVQTPSLDQSDCGLMLIDIDHFKYINDRFGHEVGDQVLCEIAEIIGSHAAPGVMPARMGGEEFALFGPLELISGPAGLALLQDIRTSAMPHGAQVTASIGIAFGRLECEESWRNLYRKADSALYEAKSRGRNRLAFAGEINAQAEMQEIDSTDASAAA